MTKNDSRQDLVEGLSVPKIVSVVGCGGVGSNVAQIVASVKGVTEVRLFDNDKLEPHNRERVFIPAKYVGRRKDIAMAAFLRSVYPGVKFVPCGQLKPKTSRKLKGVVFCTTDQLQSQIYTQYVANRKKLRFVRVGADGNHITIAPSMDSIWGQGMGGYTVPSWRGPVVLAAAKAVCDAFLGVRDIVSLDVREIRKRTDGADT